MRHNGIFLGIMMMVVAACSQKKTDTSPPEDTTMIELGVRSDELGLEHVDSVMSDNDDKSQKTIQAKPIEDKRSFYQRGYDEGYDNGREDGTMDLGNGYSYCDANPYKEAAKRDYERGYKHGYNKGYNEGLYEYSDGDEEDYNEY